MPPVEQAEGAIVIDAPLEDVVEVIEAFEAYPEWADVRSVEVKTRGEGGRGIEVAYQIDVPVLGSATYTLRYTFAAGDTAISWISTDAHGAVRDVRGEYLLDDLGDRTKVTYRLSVELGALVPGFIRTQGAKRVIENALERLKRRAEMG
jgi:uncharacterized membrane protein